MIICTHISSFVIFYNLDDLKLNHSFVKHIYHLHIALGLFLAPKSFVKIKKNFFRLHIKKKKRTEQRKHLLNASKYRQQVSNR